MEENNVQNETEPQQELPAPPKKGFLKKLLISCGLVLLGMILGSVLTVGAAGFHMKKFAHPHKGPKMIVERMRHELDLTDEQAAQAEEIFKATHEKIHPMIKKEFAP